MSNIKTIFLSGYLVLIGAYAWAQQYPFQDPNQSIELRTQDLISRLTLEEKIGQMTHYAEAVDRLGIPKYNWWNESLHGVARAGSATIFPQAIGLAATWDTDLMYRIGSVIGIEARAKFNVFTKHGQRGIFEGLTFWSPNVNIFRDPRWGRGQETYGEDPYLTSRLGVEYVKGLQGDHPKYMKAAGMAKHFAVHNGPEELRHVFDAEVSMKDLWETYLPAFEALVKEGDVEGIMGAYNRTNGDLCCAHPYLMQEVLREKWGFDGYYVSDCWAIQDFYTGHKVVETAAEAAALGVNSGCNLNCGVTYKQLAESVELGLTTEEEIDRNLAQLLPTRFRLGLFDPVGTVPFDTLGTEYIRKKEHIELSREAAIKSVVLLKNDDQTLPLQKDVPGVYITGPTAADVSAMLSNYYGVSSDIKTLMEGIVGKVSPQTAIQYKPGSVLAEPNNNPIDWYSSEAAVLEVTIACVGINNLIEGEEGDAIASKYKGDRNDITLPEHQIEFLRRIREKADKLVVVITGGSAITCPEVYEMADALLYAWYPGEQGGAAVADIIFGDAVPSGRLPVTFVQSLEDLPPYEDYSMANRTYRYLTKEPFLPFGFGLSYTTFEYTDLTLSSDKIKKDQIIQANVILKNTGEVAGEEVVQFYLSDLEASVDVPMQALKGFQRVSLEPGEEKSVAFEITPQMMELIDENGERKLEKGQFRIYVGGSSPSGRNAALGAADGLSATFAVR